MGSCQEDRGRHHSRVPDGCFRPPERDGEAGTCRRRGLRGQEGRYRGCKERNSPGEGCGGREGSYRRRRGQERTTHEKAVAETPIEESATMEDVSKKSSKKSK